MTGELRRLVNDRLFVDAAELWAEARDVSGASVGPAPGGDGVPQDPRAAGRPGRRAAGRDASFTEAVTALVRTEVSELGGQWV